MRLSKAERKRRSEAMRQLRAVQEAERKREAERKAAEANLITDLLPHSQDNKLLKTESVYHLGNQVISVYSSEGRITRFIMNDASNNSFETTIEEA